MARDRILITVKTYPTLSQKYGETVCTAGVREDGSWVRLYPVPFRRLGAAERYHKFDWVECDLLKRDKDPRPESYCPVDSKQLVRLDHMGTEGQWRERRNLLLNTGSVFTRLSEVIDGAKSNTMSLATFKPTEILEFHCEEEDREWDPEKVARMRKEALQGELFPEDEWRRTFKLIPKLPYRFSYRFRDADGTESKLMILDWEIGALYWNCVKDHNEAQALEKVREKYFGEFLKKDLHFFLGTTQQFHSYAPNPWLIIGVFPIPHQTQLDLGLT